MVPDIILLNANRVWRTYLGGMMLDKRDGNFPAEDSHFPEDWIASTTNAVNPGREEFTEEGISRLTIDGNSYLLTEVLEKYPNEMIGQSHFQKYGPSTQFLIKYLDSSIRLHLQVHPTIEFAKEHLNCSFGKTEAYIILEVRKSVINPFIYFGFQNPIDKKKFRQAVKKQEIETLLDCFEKIPVSPGDVFIVPGGVPHAIGPGVLMVEIMEPSDFVARLEFERGGYKLPEPARFMNKDIDFAIRMISFEEISVDEIKSKYFCKPRIFQEQEGGLETILIDEQQTHCFSVHRLKITEKFGKRSNTFYICIVVEGKGTVKTTKSNVTVKKGDRLFIPFRTEEVEFLAEDYLELILAFPPN